MQRTNYGKANKKKSETNDNQTISSTSVPIPEEETNPVDLQREYGPLSDFALAALQLDMLLNPIVTQVEDLQKEERARAKSEKKEGKKGGKVPSGVPTLKSKLLASKRVMIVELLGSLTTLCQSGKLTYLDFLQAQRLIDTFEYKLLSGDPQIDTARKTLDSAINKFAKGNEKQWTQDFELQTMYQAIGDLWPIQFEQFCITLTSEIKRGTHGTSSVSAQTTWAQIEGQFGELLLCKSMIIRIDKIARTQPFLYTWDVSELIIKVFQKTTRRFKVATILKTVTSIASIYPCMRPLTCGQRILPDAFQSIKAHVNALVVGAVSAKGKEQGRQLQALVSILKQDPTLVCVGYEMTIGKSEPADLVFERRERGLPSGRMVIEIESMPPKHVQNACAYLKERYEEKRRTIGQFLDCQMLLMMPVGTVIPVTEWAKIEQDKGLLIWKEKPLESADAHVIRLSTDVIITLGKKIVAFQECVQKLVAGSLPCGQVRLEISTFYQHEIFEYLSKILKEDEMEIFTACLQSAAQQLCSLDKEDDTSTKVSQDAFNVLEAMGRFLAFVVEE